MVCFIGRYHVLAGLLALAAYLTVGVVIPMWNGKRGSQKGMEFRTGFGELNSFVLDSLRGLDETIQYGQGEKRKEQMSGRSKELASVQENLRAFCRNYPAFFLHMFSSFLLAGNAGLFRSGVSLFMVFAAFIYFLSYSVLLWTAHICFFQRASSHTTGHL